MPISITKTNRIPQVVKQLEQDIVALIDDVADFIVEEARRLAPVDSGALRDSIHKELSGLLMLVAVDAPYASYVEFGTRFQASQPFFLPAVEAGRRRLEDGLKRIFNR